ncbi:TetR/AcrR family transcriptional regulator [Amycolatopsis benzoatilytica]|uniref:TetR/AcrR family transcriptional regulator n=1 Tax=Amycolatopsis benzoatilytica TaxID=346045 RepID=UPI000369E3D8|nr:TetR/AcrR family transcriptional regulator [Amycolatopsis benzoatilytica]
MGTEAARLPGTRGTATEQRLIAAAERLFAEHGVGSVSLRTVMQAARTNVAAIHYHFGSKEGLLDAVLRSRLDQVTGERNAVLREFPEQDITARELARAYVQPVVAVLESGGECWIRLVGQLLTAGGDGLGSVADSFFERNAAFVALLERLNPGVPRRTLDFRLSQAMTVTLNVLGDVGRTRRLHGPDAADWTVSEIVDALIDVVTSVIAA